MNVGGRTVKRPATGIWGSADLSGAWWWGVGSRLGVPGSEHPTPTKRPYAKPHLAPDHATVPARPRSSGGRWRTARRQATGARSAGQEARRRRAGELDVHGVGPLEVVMAVLAQLTELPGHQLSTHSRSFVTQYFHEGVFPLGFSTLCSINTERSAATTRVLAVDFRIYG